MTRPSTRPPDMLLDRLQQAVGSGFRIERVLSGGGMSDVFLATQASPERRVVIKVLPRRMADFDSEARFQREIALIAALQHPQIVPIIAAGEVDGLPYFVMPYVPGNSLRERLVRGPLSIREVIAILTDVTRALVYAHEHGVVHRDVKPDNILMTADSAVLSDFGIARLLSGVRTRRDLEVTTPSGPRTFEGTSPGTPAYMAPEQLVAASDVDHRADLYALGVVAYELLAGSAPFTSGTPQQILASRLTEPAPPLSRRRADLPPRLGNLVHWCLEKEPGKRPATASSVLYALEDPELLTAGARDGQARGREGDGRSGHAGIKTRYPGRRLLDASLQDFKYAIRGMRLRPGFAALVVATFALGIGANATMFGILDRLIFRPPAHIEDIDRVVQMHVRRSGSPNVQTAHPYSIYRDFLREVSDFENVAVTTGGSSSSRDYYSLGRGPDAGQVAGAQVSPSFFPLLGVKPFLGRFFKEDEAGEVDPQKLAVLGYRFWQRHFGGRHDAVGASLDLGIDRYTIVGVAPEGFTGIELSDVDVWIPIAAAGGLRSVSEPDWKTTRNSQWLYVIARLKPGVRVEHAEGQATVVFRAGEREAFAIDGGHYRTHPDSMVVALSSILPHKSMRTVGLGAASSELRVSKLLGALSALVLLIACANVSTMLLVRAMERRREIAIRLALGIARGRLVSQLLIEGLVLSALGAIGALACIQIVSGSLRATLLADSAWTGGAVDGRMLAYAAFAALATGLLSSFFPAWQASRADLTSALKAGGREGSASRSQARTALLVTQAALATVLLVGAGLFVGSLRNVARLPIGVDVNRVLVAELRHSSVGMSNAEARQMFRRFTQAAKEVPGITGAATTIAMSFGLGWGARLVRPGREAPPATNNPSQYAVTAEYFDVMGVRLVSGRTFTESDRAGSELVAVINETAARTFWPGEDPLGQCVKVGGDTMPCATVIGIVRNARRQRLFENPVSQVYRPLDQVPAAQSDQTVSTFGFSLVARTTRNPASVAEPLRRALQAADPRAPFVPVAPLSTRVSRFTRSWTLGATMLSIFGALAIVLAATGLYSVATFTVAQRQHEFGVRVALGATTANLVRLTLGRGVAPAVAGLLIGLAFVLVGARFLEGMLFELSPRDPVVLGSVSALLLAAAVVANWVPALRAANVDPARGLKAD